MTLEAPPIQEPTTEANGRFPQTWLRWFQTVTNEINTGGAGGASWGGISGILADQSDLQAALDAKQDQIDTFEFVSKNIDSYDYTLNYAGGNLSSIVYDLGGGDVITKSLNYSGGNLSSVVLSGDLPSGLTITTKTLSYTGGDLTAIDYT